MCTDLKLGDFECSLSRVIRRKDNHVPCGGIGIRPLGGGYLEKAYLFPLQLANVLFCLFGNYDQLVVFTKRGTDLRVTCFC